MDHLAITDQLINELALLTFQAPVVTVYNPLLYARENYDHYWRLYGSGEKQTLFLGMNPGPWGMAQTGVPFGDVFFVRDWLKLTKPVGKPVNEHPDRPIMGLDCQRGEVSGQRVWGWVKSRFSTPERFFSRFFIANYCPLIFFDAAQRNLTPDKLPKKDREPVLNACNRALRRTAELLKPQFVFGFGNFAEAQAKTALEGMNVTISSIPHPSPANPKANKGWSQLIDSRLKEFGIE